MGDKNEHLSNTQPDNILVRNAGLHPAGSYFFMLRVEGVYDLPCKSIKSFRRENEFEYIQEGGLNDYVHLKRKPISKPFTFQAERYVGVDYLDPMPLGTQLITPVILFVNKYCFPRLCPVRTYTFTGCTVIAKDYGELNAEQSGLLTETTTIAYREMICVDIPSQTLQKETWKPDGTKSGAGQRKYNKSTSNTTEQSKTAMEDKAALWKMDGTKKGGGSQMHSGINGVTEPVRQTMEGSALRWKMNGTKKGRGIRCANAPDLLAGGEADKNELLIKAVRFSFGGRRTASVKPPGSNLSQRRMEKRAERWPPEKSAARITEFLSGH